jgi:hypothetical protein
MIMAEGHEQRPTVLLEGSESPANRILYILVTKIIDAAITQHRGTQQSALEAASGQAFSSRAIRVGQTRRVKAELQA